MIVGICEGKDGTRFVEIHKDEGAFFFKFPQDNTASSVKIPLERLEQLKTALEDVIWQKGRYTHIPEINS